MAYTGDLSAAQGITGKVWTDLLNEGWQTAGDTRIETLKQAEKVNTTGITSKYWLVGAYNAKLLGQHDGKFSKHNDFFKLSGVSVSVNAVPLPGSMLLFGMILLGLGAIRRKNTLD